MKYTKRPVTIDAWELLGDIHCRDAIIEIANTPDVFAGPDGGIYINTLEGRMYASSGDFIIKGIHGEFYPCKPDIFKQSYIQV